MKTLCWNVHGMGNPQTFKAYREVTTSSNPQVLFLSETKCNASIMNNLNKGLKFYGCFSVNSLGAKGVLCLFWKEEVDVSICSYSPGHIDALIA